MAGNGSEDLSAWVAEDIPSDQRLYMRVHKVFMDKDGPMPGAFREHGGGMSTDWEKYSTVVQTVQRAKAPADNGAISLLVSEVRNLKLIVQHSPAIELQNRAHTDVIGIKADPQARVELRRLARLELVVGDVKA